MTTTILAAVAAASLLLAAAEPGPHPAQRTEGTSPVKAEGTDAPQKNDKPKKKKPAPAAEKPAAKQEKGKPCEEVKPCAID